MCHRETPAAPLPICPDTSVRHQILHNESTGTSIKISNLNEVLDTWYLERWLVYRRVSPAQCAGARVPVGPEGRKH